MSDKAENPRAFPYVVPTDFGFAHPGMELRDWFAGQAIGAIIARLSKENWDGCVQSDDWSMEAGDAYAIADAMLQERAKG